MASVATIFGKQKIKLMKEDPKGYRNFMKVQYDTAWELWNRIHDEVKLPEYQDPKGNGTGYFDSVEYAEIKEPMMFKDEHGRKGIVIPMEGRNWVVFERYLESDVLVGCGDMHVSCSPRLGPLQISMLEAILKRENVESAVRTAAEENVQDYFEDSTHYIGNESFVGHEAGVEATVADIMARLK